MIAKVTHFAEEKLRAAYQIRNKQARTHACREAYAMVMADLTEAGVTFDSVKVEGMLFDIEARIVRGQILAGEPRIDGRDTRTVRPIEIRNSVLPRTHGSSLFAVVKPKHWWSPPWAPSAMRNALTLWLVNTKTASCCTTTCLPLPLAVGRMGSTKRREVGHGRLAKRALVAVLPNKEEFPYTMRVVSEITESNGSSSMASVCGGCLRCAVVLAR